MLRLLTVLLLFILPFTAFTQQKKYFYFDQSWENPPTPALIKYTCECYANASGQFDGPFTCFNEETDSVVKVYQFVEGKLEGDVYEYFDDGSLKLEASYKDGLPVDEWKEWDELGNLIVHKTFDESSRLLKDYFVEDNPYDQAVGMSMKKEEAPIYTSKCILTKIEAEKYRCSEEALQQYYNNPPIPPSYIEKYNGEVKQAKLSYELSDRGVVLQVKIIESSGDAFLDDLAESHILNMVPFESAKQYGTPIKYWMDAVITFTFTE